MPDFSSLNELRCLVCGNEDRTDFDLLYDKEKFIVVTCQNCGFDFVPQHYGRKVTYEDYKDESVLEEVRRGNDWLKMQRHLLRFKLIRKYKKSGRLFDLGVGWGHFLMTGRELGYDVHGIEVAGMPYVYAKEDLRLPVEKVDFFDMEIKENHYDIVTMWDVLEHIVDADTVIERCSKMLLKGGYIFIQVPQMDSFIAKRKKKDWKMIGEGHVNYFTKDTITKLLEKNGFEVKKIKSSFEFKLWLMYTVLPWIKKIKGSKKKKSEQSDEAEKQAYFNKTTKYPKWFLKTGMFFHNIIYNTLSLLGIGDEMIVVAKKIK